MGGNTALAKKSKIDQYLELLRASQMPDPLFFRPAKAMSKAEARDCYLHYLAWGKFNIANRDALFSLNAAGDLQPPDPTAKVYISPPVIGGVTFRYLTTIDKKGNKTSILQNLGNLDARNVVFLVRLAALMEWYGATTIYHIGFLFDAARNDCHGQGRAATSPARPAMGGISRWHSIGPDNRYRCRWIGHHPMENATPAGPSCPTGRPGSSKPPFGWTRATPISIPHSVPTWLGRSFIQPINTPSPKGPIPAMR